MTQRLLLPLIMLLCFGHISVTYADDMTVFGLALGQDFSLPECKKSSYGYSIATDYVCYERLFGKEKLSHPIVTETVMVRFPISESPSIAKGGVINVRIIDGKLEGIAFNTMGTRDADVVLGKLKEKYGEPKVFTPKTVQNRLGASFDAFDAAWSRPDLQVLFQSVSSSLDSGLVTIDTKKGSDDRSKILRELTKDKRPL